eukprot:5128-Heterococcus_DN1.PRE.1
MELSMLMYHTCIASPVTALCSSCGSTPVITLAHAVTCSGVQKDGSLRIVRNGIGINEQCLQIPSLDAHNVAYCGLLLQTTPRYYHHTDDQLASIELQGIKGMWSLRPGSDAEFDKYLVQTFTSAYTNNSSIHVVAISVYKHVHARQRQSAYARLHTVEIAGFLTGRTLFCGNVVGDLVVQVTEAGAVLVDSKTMTSVATWQPPTGLAVIVATANESSSLCLWCKPCCNCTNTVAVAAAVALLLVCWSRRHVALACSGGKLIHLECICVIDARCVVEAILHEYEACTSVFKCCALSRKTFSACNCASACTVSISCEIRMSTLRSCLTCALLPVRSSCVELQAYMVLIHG